MRYDTQRNGISVRAIAGTRAVVLLLDVASDVRENLLGFAVCRTDLSTSQQTWVYDKRRTFCASHSHLDTRPPQAAQTVSSNESEEGSAHSTTPLVSPAPSVDSDLPVVGTLDDALYHPHQSLIIVDSDTGGVTPQRLLRYSLVLIHGTACDGEIFPVPGPALDVIVSTEPESEADGPAESEELPRSQMLQPTLSHEVYSNRGPSGRQEYADSFGCVAPWEAADSAAAWRWLSRGLDDALVRFIQQASGAAWAICGCMYEFQYQPVLQELAQASQRGVDVRVIVDWKAPSYSKTKRVFRGTGPQHINQWAVEQAELGECVVRRTKSQSSICHNKFLLLLKYGVPVAVWTGSTNLTTGGFCGQWNLGHIVRQQDILSLYQRYWEMMRTDPDPRVIKEFNEITTPVPTFKQIRSPPSSPSESPSTPTSPTRTRRIATWVLFAPRMRPQVPLDLLVELVQNAKSAVFCTAPFGIMKELGTAMRDNTDAVHTVLLETSGGYSKKTIEELQKLSHVRTACGANLLKQSLIGYEEEPLWGLNNHVFFIHAKLLLIDPLSERPIIVTGSANIGKASCESNDENTLVISGDKRVADIYLTEFLRIFENLGLRDRAMRLYLQENGPNLYVERSSGEGILHKFEPPPLNYGRRLTGAEVAALHPVEMPLAVDHRWLTPYFEEGTPECRTRIALCPGSEKR